jgi:site-specific DNA-cytosine methylase
MPSRQRYLLMDLFAGCGGMTRGFVDTGRFEPVFAVEMDEHAAATYAAAESAYALDRLSSACR